MFTTRQSAHPHYLRTSLLFINWNPQGRFSFSQKEMEFQCTRAHQTIRIIFHSSTYMVQFYPLFSPKCSSFLCFRSGCAAHSKWLLTTAYTTYSFLLSHCEGANPFRHLISRMKAAPWPGPITAPIVQLELRQLSAHSSHTIAAIGRSLL